MDDICHECFKITHDGLELQGTYFCPKCYREKVIEKCRSLEERYEEEYAITDLLEVLNA